MILLIFICSVIVLFISVYVYKLSQNIFTFSSWIYTQSILLPFIGSITISLVTHTYFFLYIFAGLVFYFFGFLAVTKRFKKLSQDLKFKETNFYNPVNRNLLNVAIFLSFVISIALLANYIKTNGTFFANKNLLDTMLSVSGYKRIFFGLYSGTAFAMYALLGLLLFRVYRCKSYLIFSILSILIDMSEGFVFGSKVAAIAPFIFLAVSFFYINKKIKLRYFAILAPIVIVFTIEIVSHNYMSSSLGTSYGDMLQLLLNRATTVSIAPVYVIIYRYTPMYGLLYGKTFLWEIIRIVGQASHVYTRPLFNEVINDMMAGQPLDTVSRISAATKVFGVGYANFGLLGALAFSFIFGYFVQYLNLKLLGFKNINIFLFIILIEFYSVFFGGLAESGMILISFESFILSVVPLLLLWFLTYLIVALPFNQLKFKIVKLKEKNSINSSLSLK
ncbi:MAG: O-antigen polymerase [Candidatus Micrarchaeaceae archaeon]